MRNAQNNTIKQNKPFQEMKATSSAELYTQRSTKRALKNHTENFVTQ
jgi:hypothetical protein